MSTLKICEKQAILQEDDCLLHIDSNCDTIVTSSEKGQISVLKLNSQINLIAKTTLNNGQECTSVCFHENTNNIFCASGSDVFLLDTRNLKDSVKKFASNTDDINHVTLSTNKKFLLSADDSGEIKVINLETETEEKPLKKHENICFTVRARVGNDDVISGGYDCNLIRWDMTKSRTLQQFDMNDFGTEFRLLPSMNPSYILDLDFNPSGKLLAAGLQDGCIHFWDSRRPKIKYFDVLPNAHTSLGVTQVKFVNDDCLISGGNDCLLNIWKIKRENSKLCEEKTSLNHGDKINALCFFSYKNNRLLVCDTTSKLSMYEFV